MCIIYVAWTSNHSSLTTLKPRFLASFLYLIIPWCVSRMFTNNRMCFSCNSVYWSKIRTCPRYEHVHHSHLKHFVHFLSTCAYMKCNTFDAMNMKIENWTYWREYRLELHFNIYQTWGFSTQFDAFGMITLIVVSPTISIDTHLLIYYPGCVINTFKLLLSNWSKNHKDNLVRNHMRIWT